MARITTNQARMARAGALAYLDQLRYYYIQCAADIDRNRSPVNEDTYERVQKRNSDILRDIAISHAALMKVPRI